MLFGDQENPKVISWGNPGIASGNPRQSARLAAGRRTDNADYLRTYVPVITAATADYRVQPVRVDTATRLSMTYVSMATEHLPERFGGSYRGRVYAVDANGQLQGWGHNPASAGDIINPNVFADYVFKSPILLSSSDDRAANSRVVSFKKVVSYQSQPHGGVLALSDSGVLYGTDSVSLDNAGSAATASFDVMRPVSTQAWKDVVTFGALSEIVMAIRDDGTLWTTGPLRSSAANQTSQLKGIVSAVYLSQPHTQSTLKSNSISYIVSNPASGGRRLTFSVERKTETSAYEVTRVSESGLFYTSDPILTLGPTENTTNPPVVRLEMMPETGWEQLSASNENVLLLNRSGGVSKVFVGYYNATPQDFMPTEPELSGIRGISEIRHLPGASDHTANPYKDVVAVHMAQGVFDGPVSRSPASAFFIRGTQSTSKSNLLALGDNLFGQLGVGSTAAIVRTPTEVPSPDSKDFIVKRVASSRMNTFVIREGDDLPGFEGTHVQHLYTAGSPQFSGGTTATANIRRFTPVLGVNGTASKWEHVFAFGEYEAGYTARTVALHFASYSTVPADVVQ